MGLQEAADAIGVNVRTIARWVDTGKLRGGRPVDRDGRPVAGSHRWANEEHVRELAAGNSGSGPPPDGGP